MAWLVSDDALSRDREHYDFLKSSNEQWAVKYLYDRLNIIDAKAGALMRSNAMIIGFLGAIVAGFLRRPDEIDRTARTTVLPAIVLIFVVLALAELCSFAIFDLKFGRAKDAATFRKYKDEFLTVTIRREKILRWALGLSLVGTIGFILLFGWLAFHEWGQIAPPA